MFNLCSKYGQSMFKTRTHTVSRPDIGLHLWEIILVLVYTLFC